MGASHGDFTKYPRTPHLFGSKGTDDDKHLGEAESKSCIADESLILEEKVAPEMSRTLYRWRGWPDTHVELHYSEAGPGACTVRMVAYVDESAGLVGKSIGWLMTNVPVMMQREVRRMFDRLDVLFREGLSEKKEAEKPAAKTRPAKKKVA